MTKAQFVEYAKSKGWRCGYKGKAKTMYVDAKDMSKEDIEISVAQDFGIIPDFKLEKAAP